MLATLFCSNKSNSSQTPTPFLAAAYFDRIRALRCLHQVHPSGLQDTARFGFTLRRMATLNGSVEMLDFLTQADAAEKSRRTTQ